MPGSKRHSTLNVGDDSEPDDGDKVEGSTPSFGYRAIAEDGGE